MGMVVTACSGFGVEIGGPGVGVVGVASKVDDSAAQLFVDGPSERDDLDLAGLFGRRGGAGQAGECFGSREAASGISNLG